MNDALAEAKAKTQTVTESVKKSASEAKDSMSQARDSVVTAVEQRLPASGSLKLKMTPEVELKRVDLRWIEVGDGRPNVVQIVTYDPERAARVFPAVMLQGTTDAASAAALAGKEVACDMYFQPSPEGKIAMTKPNESVKVQFGAFDPENQSVSGVLAAGTLVTSDDRTVSIAGGELVGVIRE